MSALRLYASALVLAAYALAAWLEPGLCSTTVIPFVIYAIAQLVSCRERYHRLTRRKPRRGGGHARLA